METAQNNRGKQLKCRKIKSSFVMCWDIVKIPCIYLKINKSPTLTMKFIPVAQNLDCVDLILSSPTPQCGHQKSSISASSLLPALRPPPSLSSHLAHQTPNSFAHIPLQIIDNEDPHSQLPHLCCQNLQNLLRLLSPPPKRMRARQG